jgi:hypothetical protein
MMPSPLTLKGMSELTKEYFDRQIAKLATQKGVREGVEELARIVSAGFEDVRERLDVRERVTQVEHKLEKIAEALHLNV